MASKFAPAAPQTRNSGTANNAPVKTLRLGRIKAAVWENSNAEQRTFYSVTFARAYLDDEKKWHDSESFGRDDLLLVSKLADQAHSFIFERLSSQRTDEPNSEGARRD